MTGTPLPHTVICINKPHHTGSISRVLDGLSRLASSWRVAMLAVLFALGCGGDATGPEETVIGTVRIRSVFAEGESATLLRLSIDSIHVVLSRPGTAQPVVDTRVAFVEGASLSYALEIARTSDPLNVLVELSSAGQVLYQATAILTAAPGALGEVEARDVVVRYVGPPRTMAIVFTPETVTLTARGETKDIGATALNRNGQPILGKAFTWTSSAPGVASVDAAGRVTAVTNGTAQITATVDGLDRVATVAVAVVAALDHSTLNATPASQPADGTSAASVLVTLIDALDNPTGASGGTLTLSSNLGTLSAVVDHGDGTYTATLTSTTAGIATIRGQLAGTPLVDSAVVEFTRLPSVVTTLEVSPAGAAIAALGATLNYEAVARDQYGDVMAGVAVLWTSSSPNVATIDANGLVTSVANGAATITATATAVVGVSASSSLTVLAVAAPALTGITAAPSSVIADGTSSITVTVRLRDALGNQLTTGGANVALHASIGSLGTIVDHGDGTYTATLTSIATGQSSVSATVNGVAAPAQANVEFTPIPLVITTVQIASTNTLFTALGATRALSAVARDQFGAVMPSVAITWSSSAPAVSIDGAVATAVANGQATVTAAAVGAPSVSANIVLSVAQVASATLSTISATPASVPADGASASTIHVALIDSLGHALSASGGTVALQSNLGTLSSVTNVGNGTYTATITGATPGLATVSATLNSVSLSAQAAVTFTRLPAVITTIEVAPAAVTLNALGASHTYTATARDQYGDLMPSAVLTWTTSEPSIATIGASSGVATAVAIGSTMVTASAASAPGVHGTATLTIDQIADASRATLGATPGTLTANGTSSAAIIVRLFDSRGNALTHGGGLVALNATLGTLSSIIDNGDGTYSAALTSGAAGSSTVSGTLNGIALGDTSAVVFTPIVLVATTIEVAAPTGTLHSLGATHAFSAVVRDQFGAVMPGVAVSWTSSAPAVLSIDANTGVATAAANGTASVIATAASLSDTTSLSVAQVASAALSTLTSTPSSIPADGSTTSTIRVALIDSLSQALTASGGTVTLETTFGSLSAVTDHADGTYTATLTGGTPGTASITGSISGRALTAQTSVVVTRLPSVLTSIEVSPSNTNFSALGATQAFTAVARDQFNEVMAGTISWSSNASAVSIDGVTGLATAVSNGNAIITATAAGVTANATVSVTQIASTTLSTLTSSLSSIPADGATTATIQVALIDSLGHALSVSGGTLTLATTHGALSNVVDHADGTYSATLTGGTPGTATITGSISGRALTAQASVTVTRLPSVLTAITVTPASTTLTALGATAAYTAVAYDQFDEVMPSVVFAWTSDAPAVTIDAVTGIATAVTNGAATITATSAGVSADATLTVGQVAAAAQSNLTATPLSAVADGSPITVRVTLRDSRGNLLTTSGGTVALQASRGDLTAVTDNGDGTYTATLTSAQVGSSVVTGTVGGVAIAQTATVVFDPIILVPTSIEVASSATSLDAFGATSVNIAIVRDQFGAIMPEAAVTWTSSNPAVASIDAGLVTAHSNGTTTITASVVAAPGLQSSATLTVAQSVSGAQSIVYAAPDTIIADGVMSSKITLTLFDRLGARIHHSGGVAHFTSTVGHISEITDREDGTYSATLTSTTIGHALVSATLGGGAMGHAVGIQINRIPPVVASIVVTPGATTFNSLGATQAFSAIAYEADGQPMPGTGFTWSTDAASVATVSGSGLVTAVDNGAATITVATANGVTATVAITVHQRAATLQLQVSCTRGAPDCVRDAIGETLTLTPVVHDSLGHVITAFPVNFTSSDAAVATVDAAGLVTAVANGTATVTAEIDGLTAQYVVTVQQHVTSIYMNPPELWLTGIGSTGTITATPRDRNNHPVDVPISWIAADSAMAPFEVTGPHTIRVTALQLGETKVTATAGGFTQKVIIRIH